MGNQILTRIAIAATLIAAVAVQLAYAVEDDSLVVGEGAMRGVIEKCEPDDASRAYLMYFSERFVRAMKRQFRLTDEDIKEKLREGLAVDVSNVTCDRKVLRSDLEERDNIVTQILGEGPTLAAPPLEVEVPSIAAGSTAPSAKNP